MYKQLPRPPKDKTNSVEWWRDHKGTLPLITRMARAVLSAAPSTIDSERLFSKASLIYGNKQRNRLGAHNAENLMLYKAYMKDNSTEDLLDDVDDVDEDDDDIE